MGRRYFHVGDFHVLFGGFQPRVLWVLDSLFPETLARLPDELSDSNFKMYPSPIAPRFSQVARGPCCVRSHPAITNLYSKIFYADQLAHCERAQQFSLMSFFQTHGLSSPIIFHNVVGQERRDDDSPSVYNMEELRIVQQYIQPHQGWI